MDDLRRRADASKAQAYTHIAKLQELSKKNSELLTSHTTRTAPQLTQVMHTHIHLVHRITMLTRHLHLFIPSIRSSTMRGAEEKLRATLEAMEGELRRPGGLGRVDGRVGELWGIVNRAKVGHSNSRKGGDDAWAVGDEDGLKELAKVIILPCFSQRSVADNLVAQLLEEQQRGLEHVTKVLQKALKDLSVLSGGSSQSAHTTSASASSGGYGNAR